MLSTPTNRCNKMTNKAHYLKSMLITLLVSGLAACTGEPASDVTDDPTLSNQPFKDPAPLENIILSPEWDCSSFTYQDDVWIRTFYQGNEQFDFRIGPGGVIAELRNAQDNYAALLSPSYKGEPTDRVIQWTWWSNHIVNVLDLPDYEWRFNVTQAGTFDSIITPTFKVSTHEQGCMVDVYAEPQDQWKSEQAQAMTGRLSARTRYAIAADGAIVIRRTILANAATLHGQPINYDDEYIEAWTPFARDKLDAVAFEIDDSGSPTHWYQAGNNLPSYPFIDVTTTPGYAVAINGQDAKNKAAVALIFGKQAPCYYTDALCKPQGKYDLNLMEWDTGVGILPGLTLTDLRAGDVLDHYIVLQPAQQMNATFYQNVTDWAEKIPAPRVFRAGADVELPLQITIAQLQAFSGLPGSRTVHLAPLIYD